MGAYELVDGPGKVIFVGRAENLRRRLLEHLRESDIPGVKRFRCSELRSGEEIQEAEEELIEELG